MEIPSSQMTISYAKLTKRNTHTHTQTQPGQSEQESFVQEWKCIDNKREHIRMVLH